MTRYAALPSGFTFDEQPADSGLPSGFTLDSPGATGLGDDVDSDYELYGRFAASRIEQARREAQSHGQDLNQNEQVAILDAYRVAAGREPLTWGDTFKETQRMRAKHQSGILNLARATSSAFERQAVNIVAPAVDLFSPGWGTEVRKDIATMNPYDPSRITGKAGGAVAALPLILAGGGHKTAAAIFGLNTAAESLAVSEDTGVEGIKKWGGAGASGASTAGAILAGGKLSKWLGKALATKIPQLQALFTSQGPQGVVQILEREAASAGISLPTYGSTMLAGTIAQNLLAQQTNDPNRQWDDGLGDTAFNVAAMTIGIHAARAGGAIAALNPPVNVRSGHTTVDPRRLPFSGKSGSEGRQRGPKTPGTPRPKVTRSGALNTLGLGENATWEQIHKAYRDMSLKAHPDIPGGSIEAQTAVNNAYEALRVQATIADIRGKSTGTGWKNRPPAEPVVEGAPLARRGSIVTPPPAESAPIAAVPPPRDIPTSNAKSIPPPPPPENPADGFVADESGHVSFGPMGKLVSNALSGIVKGGNAVTGEMSFLVGHVPAGKEFVQGLDTVSNKTALLTGPIENVAVDARKNLSKTDMQWLMGHDDNGFSNSQALIEPIPGEFSPGELSPTLQKMVDAYKYMVDATGKEAVRVGMKVVTPDGKVVPFQQAEGGRYLRSLLPDAHQAVIQGSGPLFEAIANAVSRFNDMTLTEARDFLQEWLGPKAVRKVGQLESLRVIKHLPAYVKVNGSWQAIQEVDPYKALMRHARRQAQRIYMVEEFGQDVKGEPTRLDDLRAQYVNQGGELTRFDDLIKVFEGRPFKRIFSNPRNAVVRGLRVADRAIASVHTSLSVILNIPQTIHLVPKYAGTINYIKAVKDVLRHPKQTVAQLAMLGAMNRSFLDPTIRAGYIPEDLTNYLGGLVMRYTGLESVSQFNNAVAGMGCLRLAQSWYNNGLKPGDIAVARDLRFTPAEIKDMREGRMTPFHIAKAVQNGVKITQFITEDPHRRSLMQNTPAANSLIAYNSFGVGTFKAVGRTARELVDALHGTPAQRGKAVYRLVQLLAGTIGSGTLGLLMRRAVKGQPLMREDEEWYDILWKGLWEACLLGPAQRMQDAFDYGGSTEGAFVGISPKIAAVIDIIKAYRAEGTWGQFTPGERARKLAAKQSPIVRSLENWYQKIQHPQVTLYKRVRAMAGAYKPKDGQARDIPINPYYYRVHEAILNDEPEYLSAAMNGYMAWATEQGWDDEKARQQLRDSLSSRRPAAFDYATYREFLGTLDAEKRDAVETAQAQYTMVLDKLTLTPSELAAATGDVETLRQQDKSDLPKGRIKSLFRTAAQKTLEREMSGMGAEDSLRVWATATDEEKEVLGPLLRAKLKNAKDSMGKKAHNDLAARYRLAGVFR